MLSPDRTMTTRASAPAGRTRIQARNRAAILEAALTVFSATGYRGATVDEIAREAGLSKSNLLYYVPTKAAIYEALLTTLLDTWLEPLRALDPGGVPQEELITYVRRKLQMSREMPRESRLFAGEVLAGAPVIGATLGTDLRALVDEKAAIIAGWAAAGRIARVDPHHLIFSIWALTQHYADFDTQVRAVLGPEREPFAEADAFLAQLFTRLLAR
jgi:TetR/AcrR family transcriptional regulator